MVWRRYIVQLYPPARRKVNELGRHYIVIVCSGARSDGHIRAARPRNRAAPAYSTCASWASGDIPRCPVKLTYPAVFSLGNAAARRRVGRNENELSCTTEVTRACFQEIVEDPCRGRHPAPKRLRPRTGANCGGKRKQAAGRFTRCPVRLTIPLC